MMIFSNFKHSKINSIQPRSVSHIGGQEVELFCENLSADIEVIVFVLDTKSNFISWQAVALIKNLSILDGRITIITPAYWDDEIKESTLAHIQILNHCDQYLSDDEAVQITLVNSYSSEFSKRFCANSKTILKNANEIARGLFKMKFESCRNYTSMVFSTQNKEALLENTHINFQQIRDLLTRIIQTEDRDILEDIEYVLQECFSSEDCRDTLLHYAIANNRLKQLLEVTNCPQGILLHLPERLSNIRNFRGQTPLHYACELNQAHYIRPLLRMQAIVYTQDFQKNTPLHIAVQSSHQKCIKEFEKLFRETKSKPHLIEHLKLLLGKYNYQGFTVIHLAALHNQQELMKEMLKFCKRHDFDPCEWEVLEYGDSLLHLALMAGLEDMAKLIMRYLPESLDCENYDGQTAFDISSNFKVNCLIKKLRA